MTQSPSAEATAGNVKGIYESFRNYLNLLEQEKRERVTRDMLLDDILTPEQRQTVADIHEEYDLKIETLAAARSDCEAQLKNQVVTYGKTIGYGPHKAVFNKGRITWDTKGLEGLMIAVPQLVELRKEGNPFVALKIVAE